MRISPGQQAGSEVPGSGAGTHPGPDSRAGSVIHRTRRFGAIKNSKSAREAMLASDLIPRSRDGKGFERLFPILDADTSDSASFDENWLICAQ